MSELDTLLKSQQKEFKDLLDDFRDLTARPGWPKLIELAEKHFPDWLED